MIKEFVVKPEAFPFKLKAHISAWMKEECKRKFSKLQKQHKEATVVATFAALEAALEMTKIKMQCLMMSFYKNIFSLSSDILVY